jgi:hypothetical protein
MEGIKFRGLEEGTLRLRAQLLPPEEDPHVVPEPGIGGLLAEGALVVVKRVIPPLLQETDIAGIDQRGVRLLGIG